MDPDEGGGGGGDGRRTSLLAQYEDKYEKLKKLERSLRGKKDSGKNHAQRLKILRENLDAQMEHDLAHLSTSSAPESVSLAINGKGKGTGKRVEAVGKASPMPESPRDTEPSQKRTRDEGQDTEHGFWKKPEEPWTIVQSNKKARRSPQGHNSGNSPCQEAITKAAGATKSTIPKFKMSKDIEQGMGIYKAVQELEQLYPQAKIHIKPNLKGEFVLHPTNSQTADLLEKEVGSSKFNLIKLDPAARETKSIIMRYPREFPLEPLTDLPNVLRAERCVPKRERTQVTRQVLLVPTGPLLKPLNLGVWGSFETRLYVPEPMRCYRCQKFGHHSARCTYRPICAICSKNHATSECMEKLKRQEKVPARCANCQGRHHAWFPNCPARIQRVKDRAPEKQSKPVGCSVPKGTFVWGTQKNRALAQRPNVQEETPIMRSGAFPALPAPSRPQLNEQISNPVAPQTPLPQRQPRRARPAKQAKKVVQPNPVAPAAQQEKSIPVSELSQVLTTFAEGLATLLGQKIPSGALSTLMNNALSTVVPQEPPFQQVKEAQVTQEEAKQPSMPKAVHPKSNTEGHTPLQKTPNYRFRHLAGRTSTPANELEVTRTATQATPPISLSMEDSVVQAQIALLESDLEISDEVNVTSPNPHKHVD